MKIFVTGGTGFIGSHFIKQSIVAGYELYALKRENSVPRISLPDKVCWITGELDEEYSKFFQECSTLVHLASAGVDSINSSWEECFRVNVVQSLSLWQQAVQNGIKRLIICGSCFEYGRSGERYEFIPTTAPLEPTGAYAASKAAASMAAIALGIESQVEVIILRPFHVYGEGEAPHRLWPSLRAKALSGEDFLMTEGEQIRDFTPVELVADFFKKTCLRQDIRAGSPVLENMGSGFPVTLAEFASTWWTKWKATGTLKKGALPYRKNEMMRLVPDLRLNRR